MVCLVSPGFAFIVQIFRTLWMFDDVALLFVSFASCFSCILACLCFCLLYIFYNYELFICINVLLFEFVLLVWFYSSFGFFLFFYIFWISCRVASISSRSNLFFSRSPRISSGLWRGVNGQHADKHNTITIKYKFRKKKRNRKYLRK